ncbi:MAG: 16S rRNA (cytidine(1402)-2'-O)-methyltransferase [Actinomycetota bacterium]
MPGRLVICATPIGNLEDASPRLLRTLAEADLVAAEDTRRARKLLTHYGIRARLVSYHEANERARVPALLEHLRRGELVALVSDSGMPAISDPGYRIVQACVEESIPVGVVPGPSAVLAALAVSGLPTDRFAFEGFLPRRSGERRRRLEALADEARTLVVFESPTRLIELLEDIQSVLGDRRVAVARELTKVHEEVLRGSAGELLDALREREVLGEVAVVVEGAPAPAGGLERAVEEARLLIAEGLPPSKAAASVAARSSVTRREVYEALLNDEQET